MKFKILFIFLILKSFYLSAQDNNHYSLQLEYIHGSVLKHKPKISHLAISHPKGFSLAFNKKTTNKDSILVNYNYPNYGLTFTYQDYNNHIIGQTYALQFHYNFYFGNRNKKNQFYLKLAQGVAYNTNPFDLETNNKNVALGSNINANTSVGINYKRKQLFKGIDASFGLLLSHFSNGAVKPPNTGLNLISFTTGFNYNFDYKNPLEFKAISEKELTKKSEPLKYNFQFVAGLNSVGNLLDQQFPYYTITAYADKRLNNKSIFNFGTEVFFSKFLKELIKYNAIAFPEKPEETGDADYKRVSLIIGHELVINKFSILTQFGYYIYYPYKYETRFYERVGVKRYFGNKFFASLSIKAHIFLAESIDLGIGIRL